MDDLISRQAAIDALAKFVPYAICDESTESYTNGLMDAYNLILQLPSAQPERKTGRWIPQDHNRRSGYVTTTVYYYPKCSECGHSGNYDMSYCPNCGAWMGGEQDGDMPD